MVVHNLAVAYRAIIDGLHIILEINDLPRHFQNPLFSHMHFYCLNSNQQQILTDLNTV